MVDRVPLKGTVPYLFAGVACDPPADEPYGVRMLKVTDPEGHQWGFMCRIDEVPFPPDPT